MTLGLEHPNFVADAKARWSGTPLDMSVVEFYGSGDPFFGGTADDRPLGKNGRILSRMYRREDVATFATVEAAHEAALAIPNRRCDSRLGVLPRWR